MGYKQVYSLSEMRKVERAFDRKINNAMINAASLISDVIMYTSKGIIDSELEKYQGGGALFNSIKKKGIKMTEFDVIASDYGGNGFPEIEEGWGGRPREFRSIKRYPKLKGWMESKDIKSKWGGVFVGNSPRGVPHPKGLHYFQRGFNKGVEVAPRILNKQVSRVSV